jgi:transcriptional regulator
MEKPEEILAFMQQYNFAVMVSTTNNKLHATHLPFMINYDDESLLLLAHFAKENPQAEYIDNQEVMIIFAEPHAYISPTLYHSYPNVPTWNYVAVHAYGQVRILNEAETLLVMEKTVAHFEPQKERFWDNLPPNYRKSLLNDLVAFEISITKIDAKKKLNQNKTEQDKHTIIASLQENKDESARKIAELMKVEMINKS